MKLINKPNSDAIITSFIRGAKLPCSSNALPHNQDLLIIHREISGVHTSSVIPTNDAVIIRFYCVVQTTYFPNIYTTVFYSHGYGHKTLRFQQLIEGPHGLLACYNYDALRTQTKSQIWAQALCLCIFTTL